MKSGYYRVFADGKWVYEHRYVMEKKLGRPLVQREVVHHKDGDRQNNSPDNLQLFCKPDHDRYETYRRRQNGEKIAHIKRPDITKELIAPLMQQGFSLRTIAIMLCTSHSTIRAKLK
jgi:hypothetical protein